MKNKPTEVSAVFRALKANAKAAGLSVKHAVYCGCDTYEDGRVKWAVGSNTEDGSSTLIYSNGVWYYRDPHTGEDTLCKGGFSEAMDNTKCWFTG